MEVSYSLSDLANEYLAANPTSNESSMVDLTELSGGLNLLSAEKRNNLSSLSARDLSSNSSLHMDSSSSSSKSKQPSKLEFIPSSNFENSELNLFEVAPTSAGVGNTDRVVPNKIRDEALERSFDYERQLEREKRRCSARKRIRIDDGSAVAGSKAKSAKTATSSSKSPQTKGKQSKSKSNTTQQDLKIQVFDFAIPSPDDIVIAKQKFAFKNLRIK